MARPGTDRQAHGSAQGEAGFASPAHFVVRPDLFIDVQHGLGNRLRAIASASVIAQRTDRHLVVLWERDHHCEAAIGDLLRYDGPVIETDCRAELRARSEHVYNYMEIEEDSAFQAPILASDDALRGDVYIRSAYTLNSPYFDRPAEEVFLQNLRACDPVLEMVRSVEHPSDVAVHIRMATGPAFDHLSYESPENWPAERHLELMEWRQKSDVSKFVTRLDSIIAAGDAETIFVAADLPATYSALIETYGARVRYLKRSQYDRSAAQLQTALADMMLLTSARYFLASTWSSFSDVAQRLAGPGRPCEQSGTDF